MNLSPIDRELLVALRQGGYVKGNPGNPRDLLSIDWAEANSAARRLNEAGFVKSVHDSARPGAYLVRLTDAGRDKADILIESSRKPTFRERIKALPLGKGVWDIVKVIVAAAVGWLAKSLTG